jgi:RNA polymerase sigma-70 factor (ECF subfamily)
MDPIADTSLLLPIVKRCWRNPKLLKRISQEDMLQKILTEVHSSEATGNGPERASRTTWLAAIAQKVIDGSIREHYRKIRDIRCEESLPVFPGLGMSPGAIADQTSPSGHAIRNERALRVADALDRLPPDEQSVAILYFYDELTIAEIGQVLDRGTSTVGYWLQKALARLADELRGLDSRPGPFTPP